MRYDIDIHYLIPKEIAASPEHAKLFNEIGFNANSRGNYVAMFRDPEVVSALEGASQDVKDYLKASGFSPLLSGGTLPHGIYDGADQGQFMDICTRLADNAKTHDLSRARWNGFDLQAFYKHLVAMQCIRPAASAAPAQYAPHTTAQTEEWTPPSRTYSSKASGGFPNKWLMIAAAFLLIQGLMVMDLPGTSFGDITSAPSAQLVAASDN